MSTLPELGEEGQALHGDAAGYKAVTRGPSSSKSGGFGQTLSFPTTHEAGVTWQGLRGSGGGGEIFLVPIILGLLSWLQKTGLKKPKADALYH